MNSNRIEVVTDVRLSDDRPELIVVRQAFTINDAMLVPDGAPKETVLKLATRKANAWLKWSIQAGLEPMCIAHVQNIGLSLLEVHGVTLEVRLPDNNSTLPPQLREMSQAVHFHPSDREQFGPLVIGETRDWYLPADHFDMIATSVLSQPPEKTRVVVHSGQDEVAVIEGSLVVPILEHLNAIPRIQMDRRIAANLDALSPSDRAAVHRALHELERSPIEQMPHSWRLNEQDSLFAILISPTLRLIVQHHGGMRYSVIDLVNAETLRHLLPSVDAESLTE